MNKNNEVTTFWHISELGLNHGVGPEHFTVEARLEWSPNVPFSI